MRFLNDVALAIRHTLILLLVVAISILYGTAMWLTTDEQRRQLKETYNG